MAFSKSMFFAYYLILNYVIAGSAGMAGEQVDCMAIPFSILSISFLRISKRDGCLDDF